MDQYKTTELAQQYLISLGHCPANVRFAKLILANSLDPTDMSYPNDVWAIIFEIGIPNLEPDFFVLHVCTRTESVFAIPVM